MFTEEVGIRRVRTTDLDDLAALIAESFADEVELSPWSASNARAQVVAALVSSRPPISWGLRLTSNTEELWVAVENGETVGCYALSGGSTLVLSTVAVRPDRRQRGVGRVMMRHALERARDRRAHRLVLDVLADNAPAVSLYRSLGMRPYDQRRSYTRPISGTPPPSAPDGFRLVPFTTQHNEAWPRAFVESVPVEARRLDDLYRREYLSHTALGRLAERFSGNRTLRRLARRSSGSRRTLRHVAILDDRPVAFSVVKMNDKQPVADILPVIRVPEAEPYLGAVLEELASYASGSCVRYCRAYLAETRAADWSTVEHMGYRYERSWLHMYLDLVDK